MEVTSGYFHLYLVQDLLRVLGALGKMSTPHEVSMADRRLEDRDRLIHARLDEIEREYKTLMDANNKLANTVGILGIEQIHIKELFSARLSTIEESNKLQTSKLDQIAINITNMGSEVERTPMGRQISNKIQQVASSVDESNDRIFKTESTLRDMQTWQDHVDGVLLVLKWLGWTGVVAIVLTVLRALKVLP